MQIRNETPQDHEAVERIHEIAFQGPDEAALVRAIRPFAVASGALAGGGWRTDYPAAFEGV